MAPMSSTAPPAPIRRATWLHALLILLLALLALTAPATPSTPAPPPPATLSTESAPEAQQDATVTALRLPAPAPRLRDTPALVQAEAGAEAAPPAPPRLRPHVPTPRSVVLRC